MPQGNLTVPESARTSWKLPSLKDKLQDSLQQAQEDLLQRSEERHAIYACSSSPPKKADRSKTRRATVQDLSSIQSQVTEPLLKKDGRRQTLASLPALGHISGGASPTSLDPSGSPRSELFVVQGDLERTPTTFARAQSDVDMLIERKSKPAVKKVESRIKKGLAYMGVDWYTVQKRRKKVSLLFLLEGMYYWCYAFYIVFVILLGALAFWCLEPNGHFSLLQSIYTSAACVSQSGLAVVDWSKQAKCTYVISFCLIILGSAPLLHMVPVVLRRNSFRMQTLMSRMRKFTEANISLEIPHGRLSFDATLQPHRRRSYSEPSMGCPEVPGSRKSSDDPDMKVDRQISDENVSGEFHCSKALEESHRLEYKALGKVLKIMIGYWLGVHAVAILIVYSYFRFGRGEIQEKFRSEGLQHHWHALYLVVSSFQNNGLVMTPSSVMDFVKSPLMLCVIGVLIMLGNTCLPLMVRLIAVYLERRAEPDSENKRVLDFLLEHPRRCFTHMFPAVHTMWLMIVVIALNILGTLVVLWQDHQSPAFHGLHPHEKVINAIFQVVSTRTAGLNSINIAQLSQGTTFLMVVLMYFSTTPTVVTMRFSALGGRENELDITGRVEGLEEDVIKGENSIKSQARRYLTQDATYLIVITFLICCFEQKNFIRAAENVSPASDGIYTDFSFFKVLFELVSAYGTCGLSLGYQNQTFSFSGVWCGASQLLLVVTMILGRLRGLPDSIDASVRTSMPIQEDEQEKEDEHHFVHF
eukprot:TRINITY_DN29796_c0_g1_i1.p1 TRINITY_DN29796_c0_g1~~TRINITY_DN29796_c0_g1_i1.p1  ORF type:complete len:754 (+),score=141.91 TRINITY_DN29796_c0_g1_i1:74-2335(+)